MAGDLSTVLVPLGIFAGALVSGFTGFAFSGVAGALLLHVLAPAEAVPLMMVCSLLVQATCLVALRRHIEWRASAALLAGGLLGMPLALYALLHAAPAVLRTGFGAFLASYACYMLLRPRSALFESASGVRVDGIVGFLGGLVGGLTAMPGAIPTMWADLRGIPKERQRGLVQPYIAVMQVAALGILAVQRGLPKALAANVLFSLVPLGVGALAGLALFGKVSDSAFRRALLCMLLASGVGYIV